MSVEVFDCEQGSDAWYQCRLAIPTASEFDAVLAKGKGGGESKTRRTYMYKLLGEAITGKPMYNYTNDHMERGKEMEAEAREAYAFMSDETPTQVGFIRNGRAGASPDSMVGIAGLLEIKTKLAHLQIEVLLAGEVPPEHKAQLQGQLWISEREWVDLCCYWPGLRPFIKRVFREESYIQTLKRAVEDFLAEMDALRERLVA